MVRWLGSIQATQLIMDIAKFELGSPELLKVMKALLLLFRYNFDVYTCVQMFAADDIKNQRYQSLTRQE
jgi:hypothetical protein